MKPILKSFFISAALSIPMLASSAIIDRTIVKKNASFGGEEKKFLGITIGKKKNESPVIRIGVSGLKAFPPAKEAYIKSLVSLAAKTWSRYAAIDFELVDSDADYKLVVHSSDDMANSRFGRSPHGAMDFGRKELILNLPMDGSRGSHLQVMIHELGHMLGFHHEHQHPDRKFHFDFDYLMSKCGLDSPQVCERSIKYNNMKVFNDPNDLLTDYDEESIMHYRVSRPVILEDILITENFRLSLGDKLAVIEAYPGRRKIDDVIKEHHEEDRIISTGHAGRCSISQIPGQNYFEYIYPNGKAARLLEESHLNAFMSASLDPNCF